MYIPVYEPSKAITCNTADVLSKMCATQCAVKLSSDSPTVLVLHISQVKLYRTQGNFDIGKIL